MAQEISAEGFNELLRLLRKNERFVFRLDPGLGTVEDICAVLRGMSDYNLATGGVGMVFRQLEDNNIEAVPAA